jgi:cell division septum initiation protein DivIVA
MDVPDCIFSQIMSECIEDRLVPGLGQAWVRIETEVQDTEQIDTEGNPVQEVVSQNLIVEHVHWQDFIWSPCRTYSERRWVARRVYMDRDSLVARFGEEDGRAIPLDYSPKADTTNSENQPDNEILKKAAIYEIWDRQTKTVIWISKSFPKLLDDRPDPLGLESFEPCPRPMFALTSTSSCIPVPDFYMLQDQYYELDQVNNRISMLVQACKVVGVYDRSAAGVERMLVDGVDNTLIPVDNWAMFAEKGGIKGQVDWLPLDMVIKALETLRQAREDIKQQIYELNGVSDIIRGATKASETLGAQQLKAQFASIRIQELQDSVSNFASSIFRIKAQLLARHFEPGQIIRLSSAEYLPDAKENPELMAAAIGLIKNDNDFQWRVAVDADSMKMADYDGEKQQRVDFITAVSGFLQSAAGMMQVEPGAAPMLVSMLQYAVAGFKGANEMEGVLDKYLDQMMAEKQPQLGPDGQPIPEQKPPSPEEQKAMAEQAKAEQEMQIAEARAAQEMQAQQARDQQEIAAKAEKNRLDGEARDKELSYIDAKYQLELRHEIEKQRQELVYLRERKAIEMERSMEADALKMMRNRGSAELNIEVEPPETEAPEGGMGGEQEND